MRVLCRFGIHRYSRWATLERVPFRRRECKRCLRADIDRHRKPGPLVTSYRVLRK